ncbi:MAG: 50S ribosomal protein L3 [Deltaproteobacteria bacterium]|nr:50S ribosomal protein L3 [Deltaproteobacteria bacterium]
MLGIKMGMTEFFDGEGAFFPVTVICIGDNRVTQVKRDERDGYHAIQVCAGYKKVKNQTKPALGHLKKSGVESARWLREFRVCDASQYKVGDELSVNFVSPGDFVDVKGYRIGRGFAGVMKRHGFHGAPATHGTHECRRHAGSIGQNTFPARVFKGMKMAGRMGNSAVTTQNLKVVDLFPEKKILLVKGAVPGPENSLVEISLSLKKGKGKRGS